MEHFYKLFKNKTMHKMTKPGGSPVPEFALTPRQSEDAESVLRDLAVDGITPMTRVRDAVREAQ